MNRSVRIRNIALICGALCVGFTGCSGQGKQPNPAADTKPATTPAQSKDIWVSETTGKEYRVLVDGDVFRAEWVNMSPEQTAHGSFIRTECKRQGPKWVGISTSYLPCTLGTGAEVKADNWCHLETAIEIDSITPDRITGNGESIKKFDCLKCIILEKGTRDFFWSPKK